MAHGHDVDQVLDQLRADGERITTARRAVLEQLVGANDEHLSAETLAEGVRSRHPDVHLSTVYRTLDFLVGAGVLVELRLGRGPSAYHFAADAHHHAICTRCGLQIDLPSEVLEPVTDRLESDHGFQAHPRHVVLWGLCRECRDDDAAADRAE